METALKYIFVFLLGAFFATMVYNYSPMKTIYANVLASNFELGEATIPIVAVNSEESEGVLGKLKVRMIPGNGDVLVQTNPFLEPDLQYSANLAVETAKRLTGTRTQNVDFVLTYDISANVVGGGSAGAVTTIAVMSLLDNKSINPEVAMTGSISADGSIGRVDGILEKAKTAADAGYKIFLVPDGQTKFKYYEPVTTKESVRGYTLYNTKYVPRTVDIKSEAENWGLEIIEVSNVKEAAKYLLI